MIWAGYVYNVTTQEPGRDTDRHFPSFGVFIKTFTFKGEKYLVMKTGYGARRVVLQKYTDYKPTELGEYL